jgi:hypothetical protein
VQYAHGELFCVLSIGKTQKNKKFTALFEYGKFWFSIIDDSFLIVRLAVLKYTNHTITFPRKAYKVSE